MIDYYSRGSTENSDGSPLFCSDYDKKNESEVRSELERLWSCEVKPFGRLCPIDFYAIKNGRMVGVMELKTRSHSSTEYPDVFLNVRKWIALSMAELGLGCRALFVVRFTDAIGYVRISDIKNPSITIRGCRTIVKSHTDIEPVILVKISEMKMVPVEKL